MRGASPRPQLPTTWVVVPWVRALGACGADSRVRSLWVWMSTNPGQTTRPVASTTVRASAGRFGGDGDDAVPVDGDVGRAGRRAGAVDDEATTEEEVGHASRSARAMTLSSGRPLARRVAFSRNSSQIRAWYQGLPFDPEMWAVTTVLGASQNGSSGGIG